MIRALSQGFVALAAVGGGIAFALIAQSKGQSPEPPAWLSVLIGGAVTYFYASTSHINGQTAALNSIATTIATRRASDVAAAQAADTSQAVAARNT